MSASLEVELKNFHSKDVLTNEECNYANCSGLIVDRGFVDSYLGSIHNMGYKFCRDCDYYVDDIEVLLEFYYYFFHSYQYVLDILDKVSKKQNLAGISNPYYIFCETEAEECAEFLFNKNLRIFNLGFESFDKKHQYFFVTTDTLVAPY